MWRPERSACEARPESGLRCHKHRPEPPPRAALAAVSTTIAGGHPLPTTPASPPGSACAYSQTEPSPNAEVRKEGTTTNVHHRHTTKERACATTTDPGEGDHLPQRRRPVHALPGWPTAHRRHPPLDRHPHRRRSPRGRRLVLPPPHRRS